MRSFISKILLAGCISAGLCLSSSGAMGQEDAKKKLAETTALNFTKIRLTVAGVKGDALDKATKIVEEHAPKIAEAQAKRDAVLTPAQRQALAKAGADATKAIKDGTKTPQQIAAEGTAAFQSLNLSATQKTKYDSAHQEVMTAMSAQNEALRPLLTREQQAKMGIPKLADAKTK